MDGATTKKASNPRLNKLLNTVIDEVRIYADTQTGHIRRLSRVGIALTAEKNIDTLLEMIVDSAMDFTGADAGTLYVVDTDNDCLQFKILKNLSLKSRPGDANGEKFTLPPVPLHRNGRPNLANVSSYVALRGQTINIPDVYQANAFDFTGPKAYDAHTGYRSRSMLVIPMRNHENDTTGVLQLLNARDRESGDVIAFAEDGIETVSALASQAAVALENARLIHDLRHLFDAFIQSIATAIDEKSPYTGGHIRRVTELTMMIARAINEDREGPFAATTLSDDELEELRIAAWMHDIGKITTPEYVIHKSHKLETIFDRIELIKTRFEMIAAHREARLLQQKIDMLRRGEADEGQLAEPDRRIVASRREIASDIAFLEKCNSGRNLLSDKDLERLAGIAERRYELDGENHAWLTENELQNLRIRRGTLTAAERKIIENHALVSIKMLSQLPFPRKLADVPKYAGGHHEKPDGSGYPYGLSGEDLPLQARIMALADIFEALTAKDRPYKKPLKLSGALDILHKMCADNHIDPRIFQLFMDKKLYTAYAQNELNSEQIDI